MFRGTDYPTARPRQVYEFEDAHSKHGPAARRHHIERTQRYVMGQWGCSSCLSDTLHDKSAS